LTEMARIAEKQWASFFLHPTKAGIQPDVEA
jgi:hypothetical protein